MFEITLPWDTCTGCAACMNICPASAITMDEDEYGYVHAIINDKKCIKCHLCEKTCPVYNPVSTHSPIKIYAGITNDNDYHYNCASGGFVGELCRHILSLEGIVYGCAEKCYENILHIRIDSVKDLYRIQNSKYVQSSIDLIFKGVKEDLNCGKLVLFTGTPCQIAGLKNFLKKDYPNLITVDLVCHGVPPMKMLREQVLSNKRLHKIKKENIFVEFRWKEVLKESLTIKYGLRCSVKTHFCSKIISVEDDLENPYMRSFQMGLSLRTSCLECHYARKERVSDFTAADFWGLGKEIPSSFNAKEGVSLILINSNKGLEYFEKIKSEFKLKEYSFEQAALCNRCLKKPFLSINGREKFLELYKTKGLKYALKKVDKTFRVETDPLLSFFRKFKITRLILNTAIKLKSALIH